MNGYAGKILHVNLSRESIEVIPTKKYEHWIGGHGMGSAIFWDLVKDKTIFPHPHVQGMNTRRGDIDGRHRTIHRAF